MGSLIKSYGEQDLRWSEDEIQTQGPRQDKWISSDSSDLCLGETQRGIQIHILYHLKSSYLWSFKYYTKYGAVQAIYISLFMSVAKNCRCPALLYICSRQRDCRSFRGRDSRDTFFFFLGQCAESSRESVRGRD